MDTVRTSAEQREAEGTTRRSFYIGAIYGIWGAIAAALGLPAIVYLFFPPKARQENEWVEAGDISKLAVDSPVEMTFRRNRVDGWKIISEKSTAWVVKHADNQRGGVRPAVHAPGLRLSLGRRQERISLPLPHLAYSPIDGKVMAGPAPRPLDRYETKIEGSKLLLGELRQSPEPTSMRRAMGPASATGWTIAPASRPRSAVSSTRRFRRPAAGTRCSAAWRCSCF